MSSNINLVRAAPSLAHSPELVHVAPQSEALHPPCLPLSSDRSHYLSVRSTLYSEACTRVPRTGSAVGRYQIWTLPVAVVLPI